MRILKKMHKIAQYVVTIHSVTTIVFERRVSSLNLQCFYYTVRKKTLYAPR